MYKYVEFEKAFIIEMQPDGRGDFFMEEVEVVPHSYCGFTEEEKAEIRKEYPDVIFDWDKELDV